jgi:hypothetical protein
MPKMTSGVNYPGGQIRILKREKKNSPNENLRINFIVYMIYIVLANTYVYNFPIANKSV